MEEVEARVKLSALLLKTKKNTELRCQKMLRLVVNCRVVVKTAQTNQPTNQDIIETGEYRDGNQTKTVAIKEESQVSSGDSTVAQKEQTLKWINDLRTQTTYSCILFNIVQECS